MYMSIESIKLKINDKIKGPRQIYGEIKVVDPLIYIFRRHGNEAQLVPDGDGDDDNDSDGFPLILCGPNHIIHGDDTCDSISVDLYGDESRPLITSKFLLLDNHRGAEGRYQITIQEHVYTVDGSAQLTLTYCRMYRSYPFVFQFRVIQAQGEAEAEAEAVVVVSGTIRGIQRVPEGTTTNWITIFDSRGEAVAVPQGQPIPLDRFCFIMPVQIGKEGEEGFRGRASFDIDVDLQLHTKFNKVFSIKGQANANVVFHKFTIRDMTSWEEHPVDPMFFTVGRSSDGPVIGISVEKFDGSWPQGDIEQTLKHY